MTNKQNLRFVGSKSRASVLDIFYPKEKAQAPLLIFAHGFKGFKDWGHFPLIATRFSEQGFCVVTFNFSHNGGTVKNPIDFPDLQAFSENTYSKELEDLQELLRWVKKHTQEHFSCVDLTKIYLLGHSRGGGIAMLAGEQFKKIKKVVSWAGVSDFEERLPKQDEINEWKKSGVRTIKNGRTGQEMPMKYSFVEDIFKNRDKLKISDAVKRIKKPLCLIHGIKDETVNYEATLKLKQLNPLIQVELIEEANHTFNGKHPWQLETLPVETKQALEATVKFLLG